MQKPRFCFYKGELTKICSQVEVLKRTDDLKGAQNLIPTRKMFLFFLYGSEMLIELGDRFLFPSELLTVQKATSANQPSCPVPHFPSHLTPLRLCVVIFSPLVEFWMELPSERRMQTCFSLACVQPPALLLKNSEGGFVTEIFLMSDGASAHRLVSPWKKE